MSTFQPYPPFHKIPLLSSRQASISALIAFVITMAISYNMPSFPIPLAGLLLVVFLSVFVKEASSTTIATIVSVGITLVLYWHSGQNFSNYLFIIFLLIVTASIVFYTRRLNDQLNFEKSHMTALFENATEGIVLFDAKGNIILANPAAEQMFGYTRSQLMNKPIALLLPDSKLQEHIIEWDKCKSRPMDQTLGNCKDQFGRHQSGTQIPVDTSLSYYFKGDQRFVIAFIVDITHRKHIEENMLRQQRELEQVSAEIKQLNAALEQKVEERTEVLKNALQKLEQSQEELSLALDKERQLNEIKSRFVSMASHEFRTPLSAVLSSASLLTKYTGATDQDKRDRHINKIKAAVKHLNEILEDFLSLGKLNEGKVTTVAGFFDLDAFIEECTEDIKGLLKEGQEIKYHHTGSKKMKGDKNLLKNILLNLLSNAIKFSEPNTSINITSWIQRGQVKISVADQGMGIPAEDQEHLFSSFFRGTNVINIQGSGLGLHIVKRYLDLMNGSITLSSKLNEGTTCEITIPTNL